MTVLADDAQERLLYDVMDPGRAVLLDNLPGDPEIDQDGQFRPSSLFWTLLTIGFPAAAALANVVGFTLRVG